MTIYSISTSVPYDSSIYLVVSDRTMLVDAGTGEDPELPTKIGMLLNGRPLDMIVLTHCHYDHVGGVRAVSEKFSHPPIYAGEADVPYLESADDRHILSGMFSSSVGPIDTQPLKDGQSIDLGGTCFKVISTPGHTEGSICLYDAESKALISGDTVFENGFGRTDFPGGSMTSMRSSISRLSNIDIRELYPGHGSVCRNYSRAHIDRLKMMVGV